MESSFHDWEDHEASRSEAQIMDFMRSHPQDAYSGKQIENLLHPNGTGQYAWLLTMANLSRLVLAGKLESESKAFEGVKTTYFRLKVVSNP